MVFMRGFLETGSPFGFEVVRGVCSPTHFVVLVEGRPNMDFGYRFDGWSSMEMHVCSSHLDNSEWQTIVLVYWVEEARGWGRLAGVSFNLN